MFLHPLNVVGAQRLAPFYLGNLLGNPYDTGIAAAHLICGGVLDRFPRLQVCLPHAGGTLPYLIGRLDRGRKVRRELAHMKRPPSAYLRPVEVVTRLAALSRADQERILGGTAAGLLKIR